MEKLQTTANADLLTSRLASLIDAGRLRRRPAAAGSGATACTVIAASGDALGAAGNA